MVKVWLEKTYTEIPIADIIAKGLPRLFSDISATHNDLKNLTKFDKFSLLDGSREIEEKDLKNITDHDALRVVPPRPEERPAASAEHCKKVDEKINALTSPLRNKEDRRIYGFNHDFGLPDHVPKILNDHPQLCRDPRFLSILKDWYIFRAYIVRNEYKNDKLRNAFKYDNPHFYDIVKSIITKIAANYGISFVERPAENSARALPITQDILQTALQAALSGARIPATSAQQSFRYTFYPPASDYAEGGPSSSGAPAAAQPAEEPMEQGFEEQIALLRSFGFENEELIVLALEQANGNVEQAMEFLIEMHN